MLIIKINYINRNIPTPNKLRNVHDLDIDQIENLHINSQENGLTHGKVSEPLQSIKKRIGGARGGLAGGVNRQRGYGFRELLVVDDDFKMTVDQEMSLNSVVNEFFL